MVGLQRHRTLEVRHRLCRPASHDEGVSDVAVHDRVIGPGLDGRPMGAQSDIDPIRGQQRVAKIAEQWSRSRFVLQGPRERVDSFLGATLIHHQVAERSTRPDVVGLELKHSTAGDFGLRRVSEHEVERSKLEPSIGMIRLQSQRLAHRIRGRLRLRQGAQCQRQAAMGRGQSRLQGDGAAIARRGLLGSS